MYKLFYSDSNALKKDKDALWRSPEIAQKIKNLLEQLSDSPFDNFLDIKKLQPKSDNKFRLKVNTYRIIYSLDMGNKIIIIHRIWLRKDIYR